MRTKQAALIASLLMLSACGSQGDMAATDSEADHSGHHSSTADTELTDAQKAYARVNERMHEGMASIDGDPDVAFMEGMLAHHRGAVEMSEVALQYGSDEQVHDLAQRIIDAQAAEIEEMEQWLEARAAQ